MEVNSTYAKIATARKETRELEQILFARFGKGSGGRIGEVEVWYEQERVLLSLSCPSGLL